MANLEAKHPGEAEYLQAVQEVLESIEEVYNQHPEYEKAKIVERMVEPDSSCYSSELCIQMLISFLFSFPFRFSSFHSYL